jgi:hypothetical protein
MLILTTELKVSQTATKRFIRQFSTGLKYKQGNMVFSITITNAETYFLLPRLHSFHFHSVFCGYTQGKDTYCCSFWLFSLLVFLSHRSPIHVVLIHQVTRLICPLHCYLSTLYKRVLQPLP